MFLYCFNHTIHKNYESYSKEKTVVRVFYNMEVFCWLEQVHKKQIRHYYSKRIYTVL